MAQLIILIIAFGALTALTLWTLPRKGVSSVGRMPSAVPLPPKVLEQRLRELGRRSVRKGYAKPRGDKAALRLMKHMLTLPGQLSGQALLREESRPFLSALLALDASLKHAPSLPAESRDKPRMMKLCRELLLHAEKLDSHTLLVALDVYQSEAATTLAERVNLPLCMRCALRDHLTQVLRELLEDIHETRRGEQLARRMRHLRRPIQPLLAQELSPAAFCGLMQALRREKQEALLASVDALLREGGMEASALTDRHARRQAILSEQLSRICSAFRALDMADWDALSEETDTLHTLLLQDPANVYSRMEAPSRALYRQKAAELARLFAVDEFRLVTTVMTLAAHAPKDGLQEHVGWYLLEEAGQKALHFQLQARRGRWRLAALSHIPLLTRLAQGCAALVGGVLFLLHGYPLYLLLPFLGVLSALTHWMTSAIFNQWFPNRPLPRMAVEELTEENRTLIVLPATIARAEDVLPLVRHLLTVRKSFPSGAIDCMLLGDYADNMTMESGEDSALVDAGIRAVEALDTPKERFFYLQRRREWNQGQHAYIGRERTRGAMETLNRLIVHGECGDSFDEATVPLGELHRRYLYVYCISSDTLPTPDSLLPMIGTLAHPLHQRRQTTKGVRGFSVLLPRLKIDPASVKTWLGYAKRFTPHPLTSHRIFFDSTALYRPDALLEATESLFLPDTLPLHSLPTQLAGGCLLSADFAVFGAVPPSLSAQLQRLHFHTRGVWQLLPWLMPYVNTPQGAKRNPLDTNSRYLLRDMLRRSLVPACQLLLLLVALYTRDVFLLLASLAPGVEAFTRGNLLRGIFGWGAAMSLLPVRTCMLLDAACRGLWRRLIRHERCLEVPQTRAAHAATVVSVYENTSQLSVCALMLGFSLRMMPPYWVGLVFTLLVGCYPLLHNRLDAPRHPAPRLTEDVDSALMNIAEATWQYFADTVTADESFLPPESVQRKPPLGSNHRTNPTDIGLYLLSCLAARGLGLLDTDEAARKMLDTVTVLEAMPRWHGLPYKQYDTQTLDVTVPLIDAVGCGVMCACLMTAAQGMRSFLAEMDDSTHNLPERLDAIAAQFELQHLYDGASRLFYATVDPQRQTQDAPHLRFYASEGLLLSFVALARRQVPPSHLEQLNRDAIRVAHFMPMLSSNGSASDYLLSQLLMPLFPETAMHDTVRAVIRLQQRHRVKDVYGFSNCAWWSFQADMRYREGKMGLPVLSERAAPPPRVIAPYASALFLPFDLQSSQENLSRLQALSMLTPHGYFESIDFDEKHLPQGNEHAIVQSYLSGHQGMILCSICNALTGFFLVHAFTALPCVDAWTVLLRADLPAGRRLPAALPPLPPELPQAPSFRRRGRTNSAPVDAHIIGTPRATLLMSATGMGVMRANGMLLTRFTGDPTLVEGIQFYLKDERSVFQPTSPLLEGDTLFEEGCIRFIRVCEGWKTSLTVLTEPVRGVFLHRLDIENLSVQEGAIEAADCLVPSLETASTPQDDDHGLSIETERPEERMLTARRRTHDPDVPAPMVCHSLSLSQEPLRLTVQTDRVAFQGRGCTLHDPSSLHRAMDDGIVGAPFEPCLSFRVRLKVAGRGRATLIFVTSLTSDHAKSTPYAPRSTELSAVLTLAKLQSRVLTDAAALTQQDACILSMSFGSLLWGHQPHQGAVSPVHEPASILKELSLDAALPLLTVVVVSKACKTLLGQVCGLAAWLHLMGWTVSLCVLCEGDTAEEAADAAREVIDASPLLSDAPSAVVAVRAALPDGLVDTLEAMSRLMLYEVAGTLADQLKALQTPLPARIPPASDFAPPALPDEELLFDCAFGGFQKQSGDYVIRLADEAQTPAPWCSVLSGERFSTLVSEGGFHMSYTDDAQLHRITAYTADTAYPTCGEQVLLCDGDACFSPTRLPLGQMLKVRVQHGAGVTSWLGLGYGLDMTLTAATLPGHRAGLRTLKLRNQTGEARTLRCHLSARMVMGTGGAEEALTCLTAVSGGVIAVNPAMSQLGFFCLTEGEAEVRRLSPLGYQGLWDGVPAGINGAQSENGCGTVAVLSTDIHLAPGETRSLSWLIGASRAADDIETLLDDIRTTGVSAQYRRVRQRWAERMGRLSISTPEPALDLLLNRMLPWQARACGLAAPCSFGHGAGGIDFRNRLLTLTAFILTDVAAVRTNLLLCARHQYAEGDVQAYWHPRQTGLRTKEVESRLYLPFITAWYIRHTGDADILNVRVPWLKGAPVPDEVISLWATPAVTAEQDTLLVHCLRALTSVRLGVRGLPVTAMGDVPDCESVSLGMLYALTLHVFADVCDGQIRDDMLSVRKQVLTSVEEFGWTDDRYLSAFLPDDIPIGTPAADTYCMVSRPQSLAVLSMCAADRASIGLEHAWETLFIPRLDTLSQFAPPLRCEPFIGIAAERPAGVMENGAQCALDAAWMLLALVEANQPDKAWALLRGLNPVYRTGNTEAALIYRLEPYALAKYICTAGTSIGRAAHGFDSSAAGLLYTIAVEMLLGLEKRGDAIRLKPQVPPGWDSFSLTLHAGRATWHFLAGRDALYTTLDGEKVDEDWITLSDDGRIHQVRTPIGRG